MRISRSPFRISLGGSGTDLPSYYREHEGFLVAAAIDKHVYLTLHETLVHDIIKCSQLERVPSADKIQNPIVAFFAPKDADRGDTGSAELAVRVGELVAKLPVLVVELAATK